MSFEDDIFNTEQGHNMSAPIVTGKKRKWLGYLFGTIIIYMVLCTILKTIDFIIYFI